jgi:cell division protein FtsN
MTDREFHEIQLSGKQLVFLFISLVVLAVVTFLLGVAVGKGVRGDMMDAPTSAAAATEAVVPEEPPVQPAQELGYHDLLAGSGTTPPAAGGPPPTPPAENTPPPPTPTPTPEPTPAAAQTPPAAPAATGDWFLQTGAYSGRQAADGQVAALKKLNVPAFVLVPTAGSPVKLFRVRVGPYATQPEAESVRVRLVREGFKPRIER